MRGFATRAAAATDRGLPMLVGADGRAVRVSSPERVLWPETGFTKREMIEYDLAIAPFLLPHLRGRGVTLRRFPEGVDRPGWYQAECRGRPPWMATRDVRGRAGETFRYCLIEDAAGLAWAANLGTVEFHPFLSLAERPDEPALLVLDLDPGPPATLRTCAAVALHIRRIFELLELPVAVKTSGSAGLHLAVSLAPGHTFAAAKAFSRALARLLAARFPSLVVDRVDRVARSGRVFVDWVQNDASRSTVSAYSLRAMPWPLVSTPLRWEEVERAATTGTGDRLLFEPREVLDRVERWGDLFAPALGPGCRLPDLEALREAVARGQLPGAAEQS